MVQARAHRQEQQADRRARTRRLIELGGLVQKAGLADALADDRVALYGSFLFLRDLLAGEQRATSLALFQRAGRRAFRTDDATGGPPAKPEAQTRAHARKDASVPPSPL
jgi:hypothetical protein